MLLTTLPYILGFSVQGSEWRFTGFVFGIEDGNSYIAKMLTGTHGAWLFRTPYTPFDQRGVVAFLPYLLLGKLASAPGIHEQLVALFHLFRIASGVMASIAIYEFLSLFAVSMWARRFGLLLATAGGGLGWVLVVLGRTDWLGSLPLDFISPESFGFLMFFGIPHLALARATFIWGLVIYIKSFYQDSPLRLAESMKIGLLWLATALAQPLTALVMGVVIGSHLATLAAWNARRTWLKRSPEWALWWRQVRSVVVAGLVPAPFILYTALAFTLNPFLKLWTSQNLIRSPHPLHYFVSYGVILPFAILGVLPLMRNQPRTGLLPIIWIVMLPALAYAPVNLQRRLPEGIWIAFIVLALAGLEARSASKLGVPALNGRASGGVGRGSGVKLLSLPLIALSLPSSLFLYAGGLMTAQEPGQPAFRPADEVEAFQYLEENSDFGEVVLSAYETGNPLPAWAPVNVVIGHGPESARLELIRPQVEQFYRSDQTEAKRLDFVRSFGIGYIFWGPNERMLGNWDPRGDDLVKVVYDSENYRIYETEE